MPTFFFLALVTLIGSGVLTPTARSCAGILSSSSLSSYEANPPLNGVPLRAAANKEELNIEELSTDEGGVDTGLESRGVELTTGVDGPLRTET